MTDYAQQAKDIIRDNIYMVLATVTPEGSPWISPVFFVYDEHYNLYWVSNKDARHSEYVRKNNKVAISIFDSKAPEGDGDGVYFEGHVIELEDEKVINLVMKLWNKRASQDKFRITDISSVMGDGVWRIYKAEPVTISKLKEREYINGQYVDKRVEVDLKSS